MGTKNEYEVAIEVKAFIRFRVSADDMGEALQRANEIPLEDKPHSYGERQIMKVADWRYEYDRPITPDGEPL
jgi:hypothetical protein